MRSPKERAESAMNAAVDRLAKARDILYVEDENSAAYLNAYSVWESAVILRNATRNDIEQERMNR